MRPASASPRKLRHDLHRARTAEQLERQLKHYGVRIDDLLREQAIDPAEHGILIVGSIAEGIATSVSDVDLLVLLEAPREPTARAGVTVRRRLSQDQLSYEGGVELNVELLERAAIADALRAFLDIAPALYDPAGLTVLPLIAPDAERLLHRLCSGWAIRRQDLVDRWRDEFLCPVFPAYVALLAFIAFKEELEHARAVEEADDGSFPLATRQCAAHALRCLLALQGSTNSRPKWLARLATQRLRASQPEAYRMLIQLLFPPLEATSPQRRAMLDMVEAAGDLVRRALISDPDLRVAWNSIGSQIAYAR